MLGYKLDKDFEFIAVQKVFICAAETSEIQTYMKIINKVNYSICFAIHISLLWLWALKEILDTINNNNINFPVKNTDTHTQQWSYSNKFGTGTLPFVRHSRATAPSLDPIMHLHQHRHAFFLFLFFFKACSEQALPKTSDFFVSILRVF